MSLQRPPVTTSTAMGTAATTNPTIITSVASPSDYYQFCNNMTSQARPVTGNNSPVPIGAAASYGMVMGSKVTYVAATPTPIPAFVYHQQHQQQQQQQHISSQANFISNSLANAALATSPAILYSNPMITATAQHYLNTFFKDNQLLAASGAGTTANVGGGSTVPQATAAGIYERLVYAQMLQQQLYQSQQQAAVVAAMLHKQRINVAARQTNMSSAGYNNTGAPISANNAVGGAANSAPMSSQATLNNCARQASVVANISNANQVTMAISEEPSKTAKD